MKLAIAPVGSRGIDCDTVLIAAKAQALAQSNVDFVTRYLGSLTVPELQTILAAGLGLGLVTFSRAPGWTPSASQGTQDGALDVAHLRALGVPQGMLAWIDLEGSGGDVATTAAWASARAKEVKAAGFEAGIYVGSGCVLSATQLYQLPVTRYWRAFNQGIPEPACGFCQMQLFPPNRSLDGVLVDVDITCADYLRRAPTLLVADGWTSSLPALA